MSEAPMSAADREKLFAFVGYGDERARVWFVGLEEGSTKGSAVKNLLVRRAFSTFMDLKDACTDILGYPEFHREKSPKLQSFWTPCCRLMLHLRGIDEPTDAAVRAYQRNELGRRGGGTLITQLLPLHSPSVSEWYYQDLLQMTRSEYKARVLPGRIKLLGALAKKTRPSLIVCFGKSEWDVFACTFETADFKEVDGFCVGHLGDTVVVFAPHPSRQRAHDRIRELAILIRGLVSPAALAAMQASVEATAANVDLPPLEGDFLKALALRAMLMGGEVAAATALLAQKPSWALAAGRITSRQVELFDDHEAKQRAWKVAQDVSTWELNSEGTDRWMAFFAAVQDLYGLDDRVLHGIAQRCCGLAAS